MISEETFKRPLSPNEYLYAASSAYFSPFAIQFLLQGPGNIQIEAFQSAVQRVSSKHPDVNLIRFKKKMASHEQYPQDQRRAVARRRHPCI